MNLEKNAKRASLMFLMSMFSLLLFAQTHSVTGVVKDAAGEPMIGVNVLVKGTTNGSITDVNGKFSLSGVAEKSVIVVSYIGYQPQSINAGKQTTFNVVLNEDTKALDEVLVVGYGVVKKRDLTGSVSSIKADEIAKTASNNAMESMQGKIPGLDITKSSGQAGAGISMTLRGNRSITASNNPLVIVDGVEYGSTLDINPSDIESMEVLKDASSTAIYGTRGANGVIIITTKRGKSGKTKVNVNAFLSSNQPTNVPTVMSSKDDVRLLIERKRYADDKTGGWGSTAVDKYNAESVLSSAVISQYGRTKSDLDIYNSGSYIDWADQVLQNGLTQNYEASVSGGTDRTNFNLSLGAMMEEGLMKNDNMDRYNVKLNIDHQITKDIKIGASLLYTYKNWDKRDGRVFGMALKMHSIAEVYQTDGSLVLKPSPSLCDSHWNPLLDEEPGYYQNNVKSNRFFSNAYGEWNVIKGLKFKTMFGVDQQDTRNGLYDDYLSANAQSSSGSKFSVSNTNFSSYTWDNTLNYITNFGTNSHELVVLLGHSVNENISEYHETSGTGAKEHYTMSAFYDLNNISGKPTIDNNYTKQSMLSFFGRINYKFADKYLLTASVRADGSSVLSEGNKWGYFPSVALAWRMKDESFFSNVEYLSNLKLRASWGISGNAAVNPYQTITTLGSNPIYYNFNTTLVTGQVPGILGNKDLTWETTKTYNVGLDFGFFNNRITGSVDLYLANTEDLLLYKALPPTSVYPQVLANVGATENKGIEVTLNTRVLDKQDFKWDINWSYALNRDKVKTLASGQLRDVSNPSQALVVDAPVNSFYNYTADGCWSIAEATEAAKYSCEPGDIKLLDIDGYDADGNKTGVADGKIDDADKRLFDRSPKYVFGMNNNFTYKNFSLSVLLFARIGMWMQYDYNDAYRPTEQDGSVAVDFWTPENQDARFPRPGIARKATSFSTLQTERASYVKIKDITLSYSIPKSLLSKVNVSNVKFYGSLKNFFTFSNIDNYDPERGGSISFPLAKQVVFGVNLEF